MLRSRAISGAYSNHYARGALHALTKLAGTVDRNALKEFVAPLRHGDIINFSANTGDVFENSLVRGAKHLAISEPIRAITGSPEHHTAMYAGIHPKTGEPMLLHNFEQGGAGIQYEPLSQYADRTNFTAYRVPGVSDKDAAKSLGKAFSAMRTGNTTYPTHNAAAAAGPAIAKRLEKAIPVGGRVAGAGLNAASALVGRNCPPGSALCSVLPAESYGQIIGRDQANKIFTGKQVPAYRQDWSVSPGDIRENLQPMAQYRPSNPAGEGLLGAARGIGRNLLRFFKR